MSVFLRYGTYTSAANECTVAIDREAVTNDAGQPYALRHTWNIEGQLQAADTASVVLLILALERAFSFWGLDMALVDSNNNVLHSLYSRGSLTGVRITKPPSFPKGDGAQLSTFRDYVITATAEYPYIGAINPLKAFTETLHFSGGGPRATCVECTNIEAQPQILSLYTAYRANQAGSAIGMFGYPAIPGPIFPGALEEAVTPSFTAPRLQYGNYVDFGVSWAYKFVSPYPLVGLPNQWPANS